MQPCDCDGILRLTLQEAVAPDNRVQKKRSSKSSKSHRKSHNNDSSADTITEAQSEAQLLPLAESAMQDYSTSQPVEVHAGTSVLTLAVPPVTEARAGVSFLSLSCWFLC